MRWDMKALRKGLAGIVFFIAAGGAAQADPAGTGLEMSGVYAITDFAAAGVYSGEEEAEARAFIGQFLTIHGDHVALPTGELCHIESRQARVLRNDRESFGSAGGSWSEIGLQRAPEGGYPVTEAQFDCGGPFFGLIAQPETGRYLLSY